MNEDPDGAIFVTIKQMIRAIIKIVLVACVREPSFHIIATIGSLGSHFSEPRPPPP